MVILEIGQWYYSKRKCLCRVDSISQDGSAQVTGHYTGHTIKITPEEISYLTEAPDPGTEPGSTIISLAEKAEYQKFYDRYDHIVPGSIYKVQNTSDIKNKKYVKIDEDSDKMKKVKIKIKGATKCTIQCQTPGCTNTREIKLQNVSMTTMCLECKKKLKLQKLKELKERLKARKNTNE